MHLWNDWFKYGFTSMVLFAIFRERAIASETMNSSTITVSPKAPELSAKLIAQSN